MNKDSPNISGEDRKYQFIKRLDNLYKDLANLQNKHNEGRHYFLESYNQEFDNIFKGNLCTDLPQIFSEENSGLPFLNCYTLSSGFTTKGLSAIIIDFLETMRDTFNNFVASSQNINNAQIAYFNNIINSEIFEQFGIFLF